MLPKVPQISYFFPTKCVVWNFFFKLPTNTLSRKKITQEVENKELLHEASRNTWSQNFYTSAQNGSNLEICTKEFFIHTFELKLWHSPCLYGEAIRLQCFTHYVKGAVMCTYERDDHYLLCSNMLYACL